MKKILNTKNLICLSVFCIPLYLIRLTMFSIPTNAWEILVLMSVIIFFSEKKRINVIEFYGKYKKYILAIILIFIGLAASTLINNNYLRELGIIKGWFVFPIIFGFLIISAIKTGRDAINILKALYWSAFTVSAISLIYYLSGYLTYDGRLRGFYLSPNHLAMYLAASILIGIYLLQTQILNLKEQKYNSKLKIIFLIYFFSFIIIIISFYLTYSYAAWVAVIASAVIIYLLKTEVKKIIFYFLFFIFAVALLAAMQMDTPKFQDLINFNERSSLASRVMIWKSSLEILGDNVFFGIGPGNFQDHYLEYQKYFSPYLEWAVPQPHNLYLAFWLQSGILGLIGFLWMIAVWVKERIRNISQQKNNLFSMSVVLLGIMFYILIHGLIDTPYWKNDLAAVFWIIFSLGIISNDGF